MRSCGKDIHGLIIYIFLFVGFFVASHLVISLDTLFFVEFGILLCYEILFDGS